MRMAQNGEQYSTPASPFVNPASTYQTANPQQLRAAGITPVVINDRNRGLNRPSHRSPLQTVGEYHVEQNYTVSAPIRTSHPPLSNYTMQQQRLHPLPAIGSTRAEVGCYHFCRFIGSLIIQAMCTELLG